MKKGMNAWSVNDSFSFEETFAAVARAGFDGIELNVDKPGRSAHSLTMETNEKDYAMIRELSQKYSLPVISISSSYPHNLTGDYNLHGEARKLLFKQIEAAKALGATGILSVPGGVTADISLKKAMDASVDFYKSVRREVEAEGILVGLENVAANRFLISPYDVVNMVERIGSSNFGAYYDVGNVLRFSEGEHWAEVLDKNIMFVHVKDYLRTGKWEIERAPLLEGSGNWQRIVEALKAAGFDGYLTAEVPVGHKFPTDDKYYADVADRIGRIIAMA